MQRLPFDDFERLLKPLVKDASARNVHENCVSLDKCKPVYMLRERRKAILQISYAEVHAEVVAADGEPNGVLALASCAVPVPEALGDAASILLASILVF